MSPRRSTRVRQPPARLRDPLVSQDEADLQNEGTPRRVRGRRHERGDAGPGAAGGGAGAGGGSGAQVRGRQTPRRTAAEMFQEESEPAPGPAASPRPSPAQSSPLSYGTPMSTPSHSPQPSPRLSEAGRPFQPAPFVPQPPASPRLPRGGPGPGRDLEQGQSSQPSQQSEAEPSQQEPEVVSQLPAEDTLPGLAELFRVPMPTLNYIPPAVCNMWSRVIGSHMDKLAADINNIFLWKLFVILPFVIFPSYKMDRRSRRPSGRLTQSQAILQRLERWRAGEIAELYAEALQLTRMGRRGQRKQMSEDDLNSHNAKKASQLVADGALRKAMEVLVSPGLAEPTAATRDRMQRLHPSAPPPAARTTEEPQLRVSEEEIKKSIGMTKMSSGPGPDGHRVSHYKAALGPAARTRSDSCLAALTRLANAILQGKVPAEMQPFFAGARLYAARKKGDGLRPIAVGNVLRRLVAKTAARKVMQKVSDLLRPHQLGVGVESGAESIVHAARVVLEEDPTLHVLQADFQNAFNEISREFILAEVEAQIPELLAFVSTCYGSSSHLFFGEHSLESSSGVHQGCPASLVIFTLVAHPVILAVRDEVPELKLNSFFLDDSFLVGRTEQLQRALQIIVREGEPRGLRLAPGKSTLWSPSGVVQADNFGYGVRLVTEDGIRVLGSPLGSEEFVKKYLEESVEKCRVISEQLPRLEDHMSSYILTRSCLGISKFNFHLRTIDCSQFPAILTKFDSMMRDNINTIVGSVLSNTSYNQACLPVSLSGLGIKRVTDHKSCAYVASIVSSLPNVLGLIGGGEVVGGDGDDDNVRLAARLLTPAVLAVLEADTGEESDLTALLAGTSNKILARKVDERLHRQLVESFEGDTRNLARIAGLCLPRTGDWLNSLPNRRNGTYLKSSDWSAVAKYRLNVPLFPGTRRNCPSCQHPLDDDHVVHCRVGGEASSRHNGLVSIVHKIAQDGGLAPIKEARHLLNNGRRPGDTVIPFGDGGLPVAYDLVVTSALRPDILQRCTHEPQYAAQVGRDRKLRNIGNQAREAGFSFKALSCSSFGYWDPVAEREIVKLCRAKSSRLGLTDSKVVASEFRLLSCALMRGLAAMILNRDLYCDDFYNDSFTDVINP